MQNTNSLVSTLGLARERGTPIVAVESPDPQALVKDIAAGLEVAGLEWDCVRGFHPLNNAASQKIFEQGRSLWLEDGQPITHPVYAIEAAKNLPPEAVIFYHQMDRELAGMPKEISQLTQAISNLRDPFKLSARMAILMGASFSLPQELSVDVLSVAHGLPDADERRKILEVIERSVVESMPNFPTLSAEQKEAAVLAGTGLSAFAFEQALAMSVSAKGLSHGELWRRKVERINHTRGLSVWQGSERFQDIGGVSEAKVFMDRILNGRRKYGAILRLDEMEKSLAGHGTDTSGSTLKMLGVLLSWMTDRGVQGIMFVGAPGCSKSLLAKACGNEQDIPTIDCSIAEMEDEFVGGSTRRIKEAIGVIDAVAGGVPFVIATCNKIESLPPELLRRFSLGTYFFDLPDAEERATIWAIHAAKKGLEVPASAVSESAGWSGADIENCCLMAWQMDTTIDDAYQYVVPVSISRREDIERLRASADGVYRSASYQGAYRRERGSEASGGRRFANLGGGNGVE